MKHFKTITPEDRTDMIRTTAETMNLSEGIVEKDYWLCFVLDYLFNDSPWKNSLAFKGGTSLSKCYQLINRFSEDIDLVLDWRQLGFKPMEPYKKRSQNQLKKLKRDIIEKSNNFLISVIKPKLETDFQNIIDEPFKLYMDGEDTLCFDYPKLFSDNALLDVIRLEIGALAAWSPVENVDINAYTATYFPIMFENATFSVITTQAKRSFWEKITILHKTAHRLDSRFPARYARHYYDVAMFYQSPFFHLALEDIQLREDVILFNMLFYSGTEYHYELAKPGHFTLIPNDNLLKQLELDYNSMTTMFFNIQPDFSELIQIIRKVEIEINSLEN